MYCDEYNRQTPVLSNSDASVRVDKINSSKNTQLEITTKHTHPTWASHYKFYIKETSTEYYNLSLDRYFDAEDGNLWLSFPSNDRDKLDIETSLHLKKRYDSGSPETSSEKYKILDIKNEAPEFIRTRRTVLGTVFSNGATGSNDVFNQDNSVPVAGATEFKINKLSLSDTMLENVHARYNSPSNDAGSNVAWFGGSVVNNPLFVRIIAQDNASSLLSNQSNWYEVDNITKQTIAATYTVKLKGITGLKSEDTSFVNTSTSVVGDNDVDDLANITTDGIILGIEFGQDIVQNKSVFQGRFFVKILLDTYIQEAIVNQGRYQQVSVIATANAGYLKDVAYEVPGSLDENLLISQNNSAKIVGYAAGSLSAQFAAGQPGSVPNGIAFSDNDFTTREAWLEIQKDIDASTAHNSRWFIDEAYSTGEEPLWCSDGCVKSNELLGHEETGSGASGARVVKHSTLYGGFNHQSMGIPNSKSFQYTSNGSNSWMPAKYNTTGLGLGTAQAYYFSYPHHTIGKGVDTTRRIIDLAYMGPGRQNNTDFITGVQTGTVNGTIMTAFNAVHYNKWWSILNSFDPSGREFALNLTTGNSIRFKDDPNGIVYKIMGVQILYKLNYAENKTDVYYPNSQDDMILNPQGAGSSAVGQEGNATFLNEAYFNRRLVFRLLLEGPNGPNVPLFDNQAYGNFHPVTWTNAALTTHSTKIASSHAPIEIVTESFLDNGEDIPFPDDPAIFETEPKEDVDLDIFYEASDTMPLAIVTNGPQFAPVGSIVESLNVQGSLGYNLETLPANEPARVLSWANSNKVEISAYFLAPTIGDTFKFTRPNGTYTVGRFTSLGDGTPGSIITLPPGDTSYWASFEVVNTVGLSWHNCFSFGNGIESNRIRDTFNSVQIDKGPKVSTTLEDVYKQERRQSGLIYSGLYNSTSGINNLNQFIAAEKITKDLNPIFVYYHK